MILQQIEQYLQHFNQWGWFAIAIVLMIVEMLGCAGFLFWIGLSAGMTGALTWIFKLTHWHEQFIIFSVGAILFSLLWWRHLQKNPLTSDKPQLNRRSEQYIGRELTLEAPITNGFGHVNLADTRWRVEGADCAAGSKIKVVGVDGVILKVEVVSET